MTVTAPIVLYHGAQRWDGPPQLHAASRKAQQHGPGLYLTTSWERARQYAKGGGVVMRFELEPDLKWLHKVKIPLSEMEAFLRGRERLRNRPKIIADLHRYAERVNSMSISGEILNNLMVNHDALSGDHGVALAEFFRQHGVDAAHTQPAWMTGGRGGEDWVVLFNTEKIRGYRKATKDEFEDMPRVRREENATKRWYHGSPADGLRELKRPARPARMDSAGLWFTTDASFAGENFGPHVYEAVEELCVSPLEVPYGVVFDPIALYWDAELAKRLAPPSLRRRIPGGAPDTWPARIREDVLPLWEELRFDPQYVEGWRKRVLAAGTSCLLFRGVVGFDGWTKKQDILFALEPETIPVRQIQ